MEEGVSKDWTPGNEIEYQERLKSCRTFAERHLVMFLRDFLKYDGRSKQAEKATAQARLRLAIASDNDLEELAELEASVQRGRPGEIPGLSRASFEAQRLSDLLQEQAEIRKKGIRKEQLKCR